jgi:hypothetical protein
MYCKPKDNLYRTLIHIKHADDARGDDFSPEYIACIDVIKQHDRTGHGGHPCPEANS